MRNLKKILALVLALVMSLSLMATASAKDFTDASQISDSYKTAAEVLAGLEVFRGDPDGSFRPTDSITRSEVAAVIYRIATGDVNDTQQAIYTNHPFTDVVANHWATGYISYCYNAEYVKGNGDNTFSPDSKVTGYATLAMILRAMGYGKNGEFEGDGWEIRTASTAKQIGILDKITDAQLGIDATRELVAQILFRAILTETVEFDARMPYQYPTTGETLGKKQFGLEEIQGIVTANEYADLYGDEVLPEGKTNLLVDGETYTVNHSSDLEVIGENCLAYVVPDGNRASKEVLALADDGTDYPETFDEVTLTKFLSDNGLKVNADTEEYINFGPGTNWTSGWKIKYTITIEFASAISAGWSSAPTSTQVSTFLTSNRNTVNYAINANRTVRGFTLNLPVLNTNGTNYGVIYDGTSYDVTGIMYSVEFPIEADITPEHQTNITTIFNIADRERGDDGFFITGEVYVGTTSAKDISDEKSLEQFKADYINEDDEDLISGNENGNWLKVIDNDGDGYADYVLKTIYTFAQVSGVKDDVYTLDVKNEALDSTCAVNLLTSQTVSPETEMESGDIVYYAVIDGVARAYKAEMKTDTIDKVAHNGDYAVSTDGTTQYDASGVHEHVVDPLYKGNLTQLAGKVTYDLYFDRGGYLGVFIETNVQHGFQLVLDGWFNSTKGGYEYAVKVWDDENAKVSDPLDVNSSASRFIGKDVYYYDTRAGFERQTDNNDWNALKYLGGTQETVSYGNNALDNTPNAALNGDPTVRNNVLKTTVVAIASDGTMLPVENTAVDNRGQHYMIAMQNNKIPTAGVSRGDIYTTSAGSDTAYNNQFATGVEVRALTTTTYYAVYKDSQGNFHVLTGEGYSSAVAGLKDNIEDVYVVATEQKRVGDVENEYGDRTDTYYVAEVVVIELSSYDLGKVPVLVYDSPYVYNDVTIDSVKMIDNTGADVEVDIDLQNSRNLNSSRFVEYGVAGGKRLLPGLYWRNNTNTADLYTLEPMTRKEIAENFTVGQVLTGKQSGNAWVDIALLSTDDGVNYFGFNTERVTRMNVPVSYVPTGSEVFYHLAYGENYYTGTDMVKSSESAVFSEQANRSTLYARRDYYVWQDSNIPALIGRNMQWNSYENLNSNGMWDRSVEANWNYNDVLVYANSNGNIVYAVSFENMVNENSDAWLDVANNVNNIDYAQTVWFNCLGDYGEDPVNGTSAPANITVAVPGLGRAIDGTILISEDLDADHVTNVTIEIARSAWKDHKGETPTIYVTAAVDNRISINGGKWSDYATETAPVVLELDGEEINTTTEFTVTSEGKADGSGPVTYNVTITYEVGSNENTLYFNDGTTTDPVTNLTEDIINGVNTNTHIADFLNMFEVAADSDAEIYWTIQYVNAPLVENKKASEIDASILNAEVDGILWMKAVVEAHSGVQNTVNWAVTVGGETLVPDEVIDDVNDFMDEAGFDKDSDEGQQIEDLLGGALDDFNDVLNDPDATDEEKEDAAEALDLTKKLAQAIIDGITVGYDLTNSHRSPTVGQVAGAFVAAAVTAGIDSSSAQSMLTGNWSPIIQGIADGGDDYMTPGYMASWLKRDHVWTIDNEQLKTTPSTSTPDYYWEVLQAEYTATFELETAGGTKVPFTFTWTWAQDGNVRDWENVDRTAQIANTAGEMETRTYIVERTIANRTPGYTPAP